MAQLALWYVPFANQGHEQEVLNPSVSDAMCSPLLRKPPECTEVLINAAVLGPNNIDALPRTNYSLYESDMESLWIAELW